MYLNKLELRGFKSFPMKTDILFEEGVTAIVGPNGSGKSNISDAIRWVLGEQSVKSLRGEKMEDVIFSGTDSRKAMNYCEVSITLDRSGGKRKNNPEKLVIKRRAYRTGESEFFINNKRCRLKDVRETLMDTGIGKDGYSIIEQGKVEEILSNNPQNRRKIFDEACGIAKHRYKKNEAEKNLKKSSENLERIIDIYVEIEGQLKPLEKQQEKAKKFIEVRDRLKKLELNDFINQCVEFEKIIKELIDEEDTLNKELILIDEEKNDIERLISELDRSMVLIDEFIEQLNLKILETGESISNNKNETNIATEKLNNQLREIERKNIEVKGLKKKIDIEELEFKEANKKADDNSFVIEDIESRIAEVFTSKMALEASLENIKEKIESNKSNSIELLLKKQDISERYAVLQTNLDNMQRRKEDVISLASKLDLEVKQLNHELAIKNDKHKLIDEKILEIVKDTKIKVANLEDKDAELKDNYIKGNSCFANMENLKSRKNTYIEMENHYEGFNKGVKEILKNKSLSGISGAFGELIKVPQKYEKAVEASLGAMIQNIVVESEDVAKKGIQYLKENNLGRVTFLPINTVKGKKIFLDANTYSINPIGVASDLINYDLKYKGIVESILGRVLIFENIDLANKFARESNYKFKLVTLEGDILNPGGSITGGSLKTSGNILSRKRIIEELEIELGKLGNDYQDIQKLISDNKIKKEYLDNSIRELESNKKSYESKKIILKSEIGMLNDKISDKNKSIANYNFEKSSIDKEIEKDRNEFLKLKQELEILSDESKGNTESVQVLIEEERLISSELNDIEKAYNEKTMELVRVKQVFENNLTDIERIESTIKDSKEKLNSYTDSIKENEIEIDSLDELIEQYKLELSELKLINEKNNNDIMLKREEKEEIKLKLEDENKQLRIRERNYISVKEEKFKVDSKLERNRNSRDNLLFNLYEKYEMTYVQALDFKDSDIVIDHKQLEKLRKEIRLLGNVNLDSIEEYKEVSKRYEYYKEQKEDLENSIISLNEMIKNLVENMEKEFLENFHMINDNFVVVYKKLFGGGNADLKITDMSDVLGCDIEITAQPPGKKMKNLSLLSGGEKALTAICILFAILISKPTPFCILDEIEAPLDDVNVFRFGEYLKELSVDTQFVAVTHRRGTMEVADYIYGVTMQEKGVSSILSIMLKDAEKMIEV